MSAPSDLQGDVRALLARVAAGELEIMRGAIVLTKDDRPLVVGGASVLLFSSFEKCDRARAQIPHLADGGKPIGDVWEFFALCHRRGLSVALDPVIANGALRLAEAGT